jgi:hypothetical protein
MVRASKLDVDNIKLSVLVLGGFGSLRGVP